MRITTSAYFGLGEPTMHMEVLAKATARAIIFAEDRATVLGQQGMAWITSRQH
jgi:hypothetical protein